MLDEKIKQLHEKIRKEYFIIIGIICLIVINIAIQIIFNYENAKNSPVILLIIFAPTFLMAIYLVVSKRHQPKVYYKQNSAKYYGEFFVKQFLVNEFEDAKENFDYKEVASNYNLSERKDRTSTSLYNIIFSAIGTIDNTKINISYINKYRDNIGASNRGPRTQYLYLETFFVQYELNKSAPNFVIKKNRGAINRNISDLFGNKIQHDNENYFDIKMIDGDVKDISDFITEYKKLVYDMDDDIELSIIGGKAYITLKSHFIFRSIYKKYDNNYDFTSYKNITDTIKKVKYLLDSL